jgi:hypothetical protein
MNNVRDYLFNPNLKIDLTFKIIIRSKSNSDIYITLLDLYIILFPIYV